MKNYKINNDTNNSNSNNVTITVETGLQWGDIYKIVDKINYIIVGGADSSVGPGGYALGGGHSPLTPHYGLASDFTTEFFMVDANADIIHIYNTSGINTRIDDLFWSLKGGGGSTFGVIVNITFLLHSPEPNAVYTNIFCAYSFYEDTILRKNFIGDYVLNNLFQLIQNNELDENWGGFLSAPGFTYPFGDHYEFSFLFYGDSNYAIKNGEPLLHLNEPYSNKDNFICSNWSIFDTFQEYHGSQQPALGGLYMQLFDNLIPKENLTMDFSKTFIEFMNASSLVNNNLNFLGRGLTGILIGGATHSKNDDYTAVSPGFRHSQFVWNIGIFWDDVNNTNDAISFTNEWELKLRPFGYGNMYSNEENYECDACDWKKEFWSNTHYQKLLNVKKIWDKNQVFWCNHCVGSDL